MKSVKEHRWALSFDCGSSTLICLDPCDEADAYVTEKLGDQVISEKSCCCTHIPDLWESVNQEMAVTLDDEAVRYGGYLDPPEYDYFVWIEGTRELTDDERKELSESSKSGHTSAVLIEERPQ